MWKKISTLQEFKDFLSILDTTDQERYTYTADPVAWDEKAQQFLAYSSDPHYEYWTYEDGKARAAIGCWQDDAKQELRLLAYCCHGFNDDLFLNWYEGGYKVLITKTREILDRLGLQRCVGLVPMTKNGECIIYCAEYFAWEHDKYTVYKQADNWKVEFIRDPAAKPADETLFAKVKEPTITPEVKP